MSNRDRWLVSEPDGCHIHAHCLSCPLPVCVFDTDPDELLDLTGKPTEIDMRFLVARQRHEAGESLRSIAADFGVTGQTIWNWLTPPTSQCWCCNHEIEPAEKHTRRCFPCRMACNPHRLKSGQPCARAGVPA